MPPSNLSDLPKPPLSSLAKPPLRSPFTDLPLEDPAIDPIWALATAASGGLTGIGQSALARILGGGVGDIAAQGTSAALGGAPWYLKLPAELLAFGAGARAGSSLAGRSRGKSVSKTVQDLLQEARDAGELTARDVPIKLKGRSKELQGVLDAAEELSTRTAHPTLTRSKEFETSTELDMGSVGKKNLARRGSYRSELLNKGENPWVKNTTSPIDDVIREATPPPLPLAKTPKGGLARASVEAATPPLGTPNVWNDVSLWGKAREGVGQGFSNLLTQIERASGKQIDPATGGLLGKSITSMMDRQAYEQTQAWNRLIQPVLDTFRRTLPEKLHPEFIAAAEGKIQTTNPKVLEALSSFHESFGVGGKAVAEQQALSLPVKALDNYFMHEFEPAFIRGLFNDPSRRSAIVDKLLADGVALNKGEARRMIDSFLSTPTRSVWRNRPTGAEFDRAGIEGWIQNPVQAVTQRGKQISRRIGERTVYGEKNVNLRSLVAQLPKDAGDRVTQLLRLSMGRDPVDEGLRSLIAKTMSIQASTSLSLSGIMNMSQPALLVLRTNLPIMARSIFRTLGNPAASYRAARQLGLYADLAQRALVQELTGGTGGKISKGALSFFNVTERFVRAMVAEAGPMWASKLQTKYLSRWETLPTNQMARFKRELVNLNFTPEEMQRLFSTKVFTPEDVNLIRWSLADQIAFMPRNARKSEFYLKSEWGPLFLQFKGFLMNTSHLLKQTLIDEARAGNWKPLLRSAFVVAPTLAAVGEPFADLNALARGSRRPDVGSPQGVFLRAVDNVTQIGALGLGLGLLQEMSGLKPMGGSDLLRALVGPTVGSLPQEVGPFARLGKAYLKGDTEDAQRQQYEVGRRVLRRIPFVGPAITNLVLPSSTQPILDAQDTAMDRLGFTQRSHDKEKLRDIQQRLRHLYQNTR